MANQNAVKIPQFKEVPKSFSGFSKLLEIKNEDYHAGVILTSLEEVEAAFRVFNGEMNADSSAKATRDVLERDVLRSQGPVGFMILKQAEEKLAEKQEGIVGNIIKEAEERLAKVNSYKQSFDYDAMGSNFFKTNVGIEKIDDKFLLELYASYVGNKPEEELAAKLGKKQALRNSKAILKIGIVDDYWVNIDLEELLKDTGISKQAIYDLAYSADADNSGFGREREALFEYNGKEFRLRLQVNCSSFIDVKIGHKWGFKKVLSSDGARIIGPAWKSFNSENGEPKPVDIELGLFHSEKDYPKSLIDEQYCIAMIEARNYIAEKIKNN